MKITDIKTYLPWGGPRVEALVKVETNEGIYGWGASGLSTREFAVEGAIKHYRHFLIGKNPMNIGAIWQEMYRSQYFEGGRVLTAAISAIDIALHDIKGKALGVPVYQLLGGKHRDFVEGFTTPQTPYGPEIIDEIQELVSEGWQTIRLSVPDPLDGISGIFEPRESIAITSDWIIKIRDAIGRKPVLGIDYHHRLSVAEAASFCQMMPNGTLDFMEEPIRDETPGAYAALRSMTNIQFAIGEEMSSKWQLLPYIESGLTNFARIDICNIGGFTEAIKVAGWCEAHYIDLMPHNPVGPLCTAASVHLLAAIPNSAWLETWIPPRKTRALRKTSEKYLGLGSDNSDLTPERIAIYPKRVTLEGNRYPVPDEPGLGIDVDESVVKDQTYRNWESPRLYRKDGSYTNR